MNQASTGRSATAASLVHDRDCAMTHADLDRLNLAARLVDGQKIQLGRGDFFGELALLGGRERRADVTALGYCQLLVLDDADFRTLLATDLSIHRHINQVATDRIQMNRASRRAG